MLSLIIPTYNEARNIRLLLQKVMPVLRRAAESFEVIVVDDDSPDKSWQIAQEMAKSEPCLRVLRRRDERGLATAVVAGWKAARGDILCVMDGDLQHDPETLEKLINTIAVTRADIVIASRHVKKGGVSDWSLIRRSISWGATWLATLVIPGVLRNVRDPMSGYFLFRRSVLESVRLQPTGYKILLEVLAKGKYRIVREVPYIFEERKEGSSKLGPRQYGQYLVHLARLARETGELHRFLRFCTVGLTGVIVNQAVLWLLTVHTGLYYNYASITAVEISIVSNFLFNEFWTFRDKAQESSGSFSRLHRFMKFNLFCTIGWILNTVAVWCLSALTTIDYLLSYLVGIGISTIWNYWINANVTWESQIPFHCELPDRVSLDLPASIEPTVLDEQRPVL